jgi:hypothetical protein
VPEVSDLGNRLRMNCLGIRKQAKGLMFWGIVFGLGVKIRGLQRSA